MAHRETNRKKTRLNELPGHAHRFDLVVVGAGAAGLWTALTAAAEGARVALVSRSPLSHSASFWAQGGLAAALSPPDSPDQHFQDTVKAARGGSRPSAALLLANESPDIVSELERLAVPFDRSADGGLALALEGGHGQPRIVHAGGSATGKHLTARLTTLVADEPLIEVAESTQARALIVDQDRCHGVSTPAGPFLASATVLATGGATALWQRSTNPPSATGTGLSLALDAEVALADLELVQFHPTALVRTGQKFDGFLITEAIRGAGARLIDGAGERFVDELAPRDEVARAVLSHCRTQAESFVYLDMRDLTADLFPNVVQVLNEVGINPGKDLVPVYPAAHYMMGGIATDLDGRTSLAGLYAVGECACTGLHGANRLASNSLSECLVFGKKAALAALDEPPTGPTLDASGDVEPPVAIDDRSRELLWQHAGLERTGGELDRLLDDRHPVVRLIARCAKERCESRGAHFRVDFPETDPAFDQMHVVVEGDRTSLEHWT